MNHSIFNTIAPTDLRDFLKSRGWHLIDAALADGLYALNNPTYKRRQLVFPIDDSSVDYVDCIETVINKLIDIEQTSFDNLITELLEMKDDTINFRIIDKHNESSFIPLAYAVQAINGAKDMLLSGACSVIKPQLCHPKLNRSEAQELIEHSRFRHTQKGSFIIAVSIPIKSMDVQTDIFDNQPFVRQTTLTINHAITKLISAIENDKLEGLLEEIKSDEKPQLSSNICKALMDLQGDTEKYNLYLNFKWAGIIDKPVNVRNSIKIQKDYYSHIEDVTRELKKQEKERQDVFIGTVERLAGEWDKNEQRTGDVFLDIYQQDSSSIRVKVNLKAEWHNLAIKAYETPNCFIQVKGTLLAGNQPKTITDITDFKIL